MKWVSHISKELRKMRRAMQGRNTEKETEGVKMRLASYTKQCCEAMKPCIDRRALIRGSSGEMKVSEVRWCNSRSIHKLLPKQKPSHSFEFPFHLLPSFLLPLILLTCLSPPSFRLFLLRFFTCATEGFALGSLPCCLSQNWVGILRKKKWGQNCISFICVLDVRKIFRLI